MKITFLLGIVFFMFIFYVLLLFQSGAYIYSLFSEGGTQVKIVTDMTFKMCICY